MFTDILRLIPNLQVGYLYSFGNQRASTSRLTADYLLPVRLGLNSAVFCVAHGEVNNFWKTVQQSFSNANRINKHIGFNDRIDLSIGGGYRTILNSNTLLGVNGFYDSTRLGGKWHDSGGVGFEMAALLYGNDALDLNFNWYGNLFNRNVLVNVFREGPSNFDLEAGYSHQLFDEGPDLRLHATGYKFGAGYNVYGWRAGAELKTRNGAFSLKYEAGNDKVNQTYHTVGGFVNVGLQLGKILHGKSPFTMPEAIFNSPRNLKRWLTKTVSRNWFQLTSVIANRDSGRSLPEPLPLPPPEASCFIRTTQGTLALNCDPPLYSSNVGLFNEGPVPDAEFSQVRRLIIRVTVSETLTNSCHGSNANTSFSFDTDATGGHGYHIGTIFEGSPAGSYVFVHYYDDLGFIRRHFRDLDRMSIVTSGAIPPPQTMNWRARLWFCRD
ncbi:inverse autotransporter beta domain-containing protein [Thermodesulfobacteriota bacterium]